jgi:hypothetical protein
LRILDWKDLPFKYGGVHVVNALKPTRWLTFVAVLGFSAAAYCFATVIAQCLEREDTKSVELSWPKDSFAHAVVGRKTLFHLTVGNRSDHAFRVLGLLGQCEPSGCLSTAEEFPLEVGPHKERVIDVFFTPGDVREFRRILVIYTDVEKQFEVRATLTGKVTKADSGMKHPYE